MTVCQTVQGASDFPDPVRAQVEKAVRALQFVAGRLGQKLFCSDEDRARTVHDLQVMRKYGCLKAVTVEYLASNDTVVLSHSVTFSPGPAQNGRIVDSAKGVELPLLPAEIIAKAMLSVSWRDPASKDLLKPLFKINWGSKTEFPKASGTVIQCEHHGAITNGDNDATIFVSDLARHFGRITHVIEGRGFAFANDETLGQPVWLHVTHAPAGFKFRVGERVSYIPITVPKGLQGRSIQSA